MELQNLRHLIYSHETSYNKLEQYAQMATDPQVKQMFQQSAQDARSTKQKLMSFLGQ
jgi:truncated hemoglobin YjbI